MASAATIPHRVDADGSLAQAGAGTTDQGAWGVYWALSGGRRREWIVTGLTAREAVRLSRELNERDTLAGAR